MATLISDTARAPQQKDTAITLLQIGATAYGGPAIMGVMQDELQERRKWVSKEQFVEGLAVANMVPGARATQLGIFLAYARGGWWAGLFGGLCFMLPAFVIMLALTVAYATFGVTPIVRDALYGLGPVVIGLFAVALYRLGKTTASTVPEALVGIAAAVAALTGRLGIVAILVLAGVLAYSSSIAAPRGPGRSRRSSGSRRWPSACGRRPRRAPPRRGPRIGHASLISVSTSSASARSRSVAVSR